MVHGIPVCRGPGVFVPVPVCVPVCCCLRLRSGLRPCLRLRLLCLCLRRCLLLFLCVRLRLSVATAHDSIGVRVVKVEVDSVCFVPVEVHFPEGPDVVNKRNFLKDGPRP